MTITPNKWELDVQGYLNTCNITDPLPRKQIRDFSAGVNDLGLWNSMVCWPLRSSQNYGSIALAPEAVATLFPQLLAQYSEALPDGAESITTIGGHWDDSDKTRIRAASLHKGTIAGQPLTDGRVAFTCLWQSDLAAAFDAGDIAGVAELSAEELAGLMPVVEGMP